MVAKHFGKITQREFTYFFRESNRLPERWICNRDLFIKMRFIIPSVNVISSIIYLFIFIMKLMFFFKVNIRIIDHKITAGLKTAAYSTNSISMLTPGFEITKIVRKAECAIEIIDPER